MKFYSRKCVVCNTKTGPLHRFPKDPDRCKIWLQILKLEDIMSKHTHKYIHDNGRICSAHFEMQSFTSTLKTRLLKFAIPVNIPFATNELQQAETPVVVDKTNFRDQTFNSAHKELISSAEPAKSLAMNIEKENIAVPTIVHNTQTEERIPGGTVKEQTPMETSLSENERFCGTHQVELISNAVPAKNLAMNIQKENIVKPALVHNYTQTDNRILNNAFKKKLSRKTAQVNKNQTFGYNNKKKLISKAVPSQNLVNTLKESVVTPAVEHSTHCESEILNSNFKEQLPTNTVCVSENRTVDSTCELELISDSVLAKNPCLNIQKENIIATAEELKSQAENRTFNNTSKELLYENTVLVNDNQRYSTPEKELISNFVPAKNLTVNVQKENTLMPAVVHKAQSKSRIVSSTVKEQLLKNVVPVNILQTTVKEENTAMQNVDATDFEVQPFSNIEQQLPRTSVQPNILHLKVKKQNSVRQGARTKTISEDHSFTGILKESPMNTASTNFHTEVEMQNAVSQDAVDEIHFECQGYSSAAYKKQTLRKAVPVKSLDSAVKKNPTVVPVIVNRTVSFRKVPSTLPKVKWDNLTQIEEISKLRRRVSKLRNKLNRQAGPFPILRRKLTALHLEFVLAQVKFSHEDERTWSPEFIALALQIYHESPMAYDLLQKAFGFPSIRKVLMK